MSKEEAGRPEDEFMKKISGGSQFIFDYLTPLLAIGTLSAAKWASTSLFTLFSAESNWIKKCWKMHYQF